MRRLKRVRPSDLPSSSKTQHTINESEFFTTKMHLTELQSHIRRQQLGKDVSPGSFLELRIVTLSRSEGDEVYNNGRPCLLLDCVETTHSVKEPTRFLVVLDVTLGYEEWFRRSRLIQFPAWSRFSLRGANYTHGSGEYAFHLKYQTGAVFKVLLSSVVLGDVDHLPNIVAIPPLRAEILPRRTSPVLRSHSRSEPYSQNTKTVELAMQAASAIDAVSTASPGKASSNVEAQTKSDILRPNSIKKDTAPLVANHMDIDMPATNIIGQNLVSDVPMTSATALPFSPARPMSALILPNREAPEFLVVSSTTRDRSESPSSEAAVEKALIPSGSDSCSTSRTSSLTRPASDVFTEVPNLEKSPAPSIIPQTPITHNAHVGTTATVPASISTPYSASSTDDRSFTIPLNVNISLKDLLSPQVLFHLNQGSASTPAQPSLEKALPTPVTPVPPTREAAPSEKEKSKARLRRGGARPRKSEAERTVHSTPNNNNDTRSEKVDSPPKTIISKVEEVLSGQDVSRGDEGEEDDEGDQKVDATLPKGLVGIYIPLDAEKRTSNPDFVNVIGVVTKVKEPKEAKDQFAIPGTKSYTQIILIEDESKVSFEVLFFAKADRIDWLPGFRIECGNSFLVQRLKIQPSLLSKGLGYDHKYAWAAYNPKSGKFFTADAGSTPSMAQCRRPDCRECGLRLNVKSPIYRVSSALEKDYMKRLAKWYEQEAGEVVNCGGDTSVGYATVSVQSAAPPPGKLKKIGDCEVVMVSNSKYKAVYADVHVEVLAWTQSHPDLVDVFVTDYSRNPELYTKDYALLTSALSQTNITNATHDAIRVLAADGYLLKVAFRDAYWVEAAKKMRPGQIVRLKNLALKSYEAYLVGQVSDAKWASSETKDVTTTTLAQAPDEFKIRKETYEKASGKVVSTPIGEAFAKARPQALTSHETYQQQQQQQAHPLSSSTTNADLKTAVPNKTPYYAPGTSIYDHILADDGPSSSTSPLGQARDTSPSSHLHTVARSPSPAPYVVPSIPSSLTEPLKGIKMILSDSAEQVPLCDTMKTFNYQRDAGPMGLGWRVEGRVVAHHPERFEDFVKGLCNSCGEERVISPTWQGNPKKRVYKCDKHPDARMAYQWSFLLMIEGEDESTAVLLVRGKDAEKFLGQEPPRRLDVSIVRSIVGPIIQGLIASADIFTFFAIASSILKRTETDTKLGKEGGDWEKVWLLAETMLVLPSEDDMCMVYV